MADTTSSSKQMLKGDRKAALVRGLDEVAVDEKGQLSLAGTGDSRVDLSVAAVRGISRADLVQKLCKVVADARSAGRNGNPAIEVQALVDLMKLVFHFRDIEDGKGERDLFYWSLIALFKELPQTVTAALSKIPDKYGSYLDLVKLIVMIDKDADGVLAPLRASILQLIVDRLNTARHNYSAIRGGDRQVKLDLIAKWAPSEGSQYDALAKEIAVLIFGSKPIRNHDGTVRFASLDDQIAQGATVGVIRNARRSCYMRYRKMLTAIRKELKVVEQIMCDRKGRWSEIQPGAVPARALSKYGKALRNLRKDGTQRSDRQDRVACAQNFADHLAKAIDDPSSARVHGAKMMAHELVQKCAQGAPDPVVEAQWIDLRERLKESGTLGDFVALVDVSGSMQGTPMMVAIALGILISEVTSEAFSNRFLTFESMPQWHHLDGLKSLYDKVRSTLRAGWGGSTNFEAALNRILDTCVRNKVPVEEVRKLTLAVFSDMQFDVANGGGYYGSHGHGSSAFASKYDKIAAAWKRAGYVDPETGDTIVPKILFWDLRWTGDAPAHADVPGVAMVSGFSQNLLKGFLNGTLLEEASKAPPTPYDILRRTLDAERYDDIGVICQQVGEICSAVTGLKYRMPQRPVPEDDVVVVDGTEDDSPPAPDAVVAESTPYAESVATSVDDFVPIEMPDTPVVVEMADATPPPSGMDRADELLKTAMALMAEAQRLRGHNS